MAWVRFREISVELFHEKVLMQLGNKVGRAVKVDKTTMAVSEGRFAQIRIQINLRKSLYGYSKENCPKAIALKTPAEPNSSEPLAKVGKSAVEPGKPIVKPTPDDPYVTSMFCLSSLSLVDHRQEGRWNGSGRQYNGRRQNGGD
ncbi:hypothetical protein M9H77_26221 [Catharanthus roseus]|uniref:Uncharacterized protein n=1 Tax=Catharanthus roseus TaxID=4058 RepID=A0ACC0ADA9_CATRO|nr:hypothetical protein M9H77_26221 [Catharanthus roseus]